MLPAAVRSSRISRYDGISFSTIPQGRQQHDGPAAGGRGISATYQGRERRRRRTGRGCKSASRTLVWGSYSAMDANRSWTWTRVTTVRIGLNTPRRRLPRSPQPATGEVLSRGDGPEVQVFALISRAQLGRMSRATLIRLRPSNEQQPPPRGGLLQRVAGAPPSVGLYVL